MNYEDKITLLKGEIIEDLNSCQKAFLIPKIIRLMQLQSEKTKKDYNSELIKYHSLVQYKWKLLNELMEKLGMNSKDYFKVASRITPEILAEYFNYFGAVCYDAGRRYEQRKNERKAI